MQLTRQWLSMQSSRSVFPKQSCHCLAPNGSSLCTRNVSYLISGHRLFVLCTYYTTNFDFVKPFFEFLFKFSCKNKRKNDFDFTINHRINIPIFANKKAPLQEAFWKGCGGTLFHLKKVPPQSFKIISSNLLQEQRVPRRVLRERDRQLACRTP